MQIILMCVLFALSNQMVSAATLLKVQSFNIFEAGKGMAKSGGQNVETNLNEIISILKEQNADIIGLQEVREDSGYGPIGKSVAKHIAKSLGYYVFDQTKYYDKKTKKNPTNGVLWANAILSRYPIVQHASKGFGAVIDVNGRKVLVMNIHLCDTPYVPHQINHIPYSWQYPYIHSEAEAIKFANLGHQKAMDSFTNVLSKFKTSNIELTLITGDFNEPSHLDWTQDAANATIRPMKVEWPTSKRLENLGFVDTYRAFYKDETLKKNTTWVPDSTESTYIHNHSDRIDFIFARAANLSIEYAAILGENKENADIVHENWPSDYRSPIATVKF